MPRPQLARGRSARSCAHRHVVHESLAESRTGFRRASSIVRAKACGKPSSAATKITEEQFPAPLVLPGDDIALDPEYPPQSLQSWAQDKDRNRVTKTGRRTVFVAGPPDVSSDCDFVRRWTMPRLRGKALSKNLPALTSAVKDYVTAFYHGLPVKLMEPGKFVFDRFDTDSTSDVSSTAGSIGLGSGGMATAIRTRPTRGGPYPMQLNLNDIIDAMIEDLPRDAYAFVMLVDHDLFEDDEDEFVCGRAYGGSRVAVISTARYNPLLDELQGIDRTTAWPMSHCFDCISPLLDHATLRRLQGQAKAQEEGTSASAAIQVDEDPSPLEAALQSTRSLAPESADAMWLGRLCRTVCHELGHCFGIDHCMFYACSMQGSASLAEDVRQPPYLCPVDLAKLLRATGGSEAGRYEALQAFCEAHADVHLFTAFSAWLGARISRTSAP